MPGYANVCITWNSLSNSSILCVIWYYLLHNKLPHWGTIKYFWTLNSNTHFTIKSWPTEYVWAWHRLMSRTNRTAKESIPQSWLGMDIHLDDNTVWVKGLFRPCYKIYALMALKHFWLKGPMPWKFHPMTFSNINMSSPSLPMVPQWLEMALGVKQALGILLRLWKMNAQTRQFGIWPHMSS